MKKKKYYWLKLKENFFNQKEVKKLRKIAGGDVYTIIYLKMQLLSLKNDGILKYDGIEENLAEQLSLEIDEDADNIQVTLNFLLKNKLLEVNNEDEFLLIKASENIGSECESAERVRRFRENQNKKALPGNAEVTKSNTQVTKSNTEIEIEKDIDKREKKKEIDKKNNSSASDEEFNIYTYFQQRGFVSISPMMYEDIKTLVDMYSLEEVKQAVDIADENGIHKLTYVKGVLERRRAGDTKKPNNKNKGSNFSNFEGRDYSQKDYDDLERRLLGWDKDV